MLIYVLALFVSAALAAPIPSDSFMHSAVLDEGNKYTLSWSFNETTIVFQARVQTTGYIGFGISPNGGMTGADVIMGWIGADGKSYFKDRYATGKRRPTIDPHQDWFLISATEDSGYTTLQFYRLLDTKDCEYDLAITPDTQRLIWSYNPDKPTAEDTPNYHGPNTRGSKSINLLDPVQDKSSLVPSNTPSFSFLNPNVLVPSDKTVYWCQAFKMPPVTKKSQIIKFGPTIQKSNIAVVHHIVMYACYAAISAAYDGAGYKCYTAAMPAQLAQCRHPIAVWAVGGGDFFYPEDVGFPFGETGSPTFVVMETHYDNPEGRSDIRDNSGVTMWYTSNLRKYDAGVVEVGYAVTPAMTIPPGQSQFHISAFCPSNCSAEAIPSTGVKAFAYMLHTHLLGRKLRLRQYRGTSPLEELARDDQYDFNFQQTRLFPNEKVIMPGDTLVVDCLFDSTSRDKATIGGQATDQEMCLSWLYYYPKADLSFCQSYISPANQFAQLGITGVAGTDKAWTAAVLGADWTQSLLDGAQQLQTKAPATVKCQRQTGTNYPSSGKQVRYPSFVEAPKERERECQANRAAHAAMHEAPVVQEAPEAPAVAEVPEFEVIDLKEKARGKQ